VNHPLAGEGFDASSAATAGAAERSFGHGCPWRNEDGNWSGARLSVHAG